MGCDIHVCIQRQEPDGIWREIVWQDEPYKADPVPDIPVAPECFDGRNYDLFAILAGVRNGTGFAGCLTGSRWPSIAPDRDWPDGFNPEAVAPHPRYPEEGPRYVGDHSYTWVTLAELEAFDWSISHTAFGVVPAAVYEQHKTGPPETYCAETCGPGIETYEPAAYETAKRNGVLSARPHVRVLWYETAAEATGWPNEVLPWLRRLADGRPLRLVLGFDS